MSPHDHRDGVAAGRYFIGTAEGFTPEQYAEMALARMFESAKHYPQPIKGRVIESKFEIRGILIHYIGEAMAQERDRVGRLFEDGKAAKARLLLPASLMTPA